MEFISHSDTRSESAGLQYVSLLACFQELLVECLAARSAFVSAQRDCLADSGDDGVVKVPVIAAKAWARGLLSTPAQLLALDDATLVQYIKAADFFQDSSLVKKLCGILGGRLFKAEAAQGTTSNVQHPGTQLLPKSRRYQVLKQLPTDLAIAVLRCAPGSIASQIRQLPASCHSLVALAACPMLGAACMLPSECPDASPDHPTLALCVDTGHEQDADVDVDMSSSILLGLDGVKSSIWVHAADFSDVDFNSSHFSLQQRPGMVACQLLARSSSLHDITIELPEATCLVLGLGSAAPDLHRVTFQGGAVACTGSNCNATFNDAVFSSCTLVVSAGAQVTLNRPQFNFMCNPTAGVSIFAHGPDSLVHLESGSITGGEQGVSVQAGARLKASNLDITAVGSGLEIKDAGSTLAVTKGKLHDFSTRGSPRRIGVYAHTGGSAQLSSVFISGVAWGVLLWTEASARFADCTVTDTGSFGMLVAERSTANLNRSTFSHCRESWGVTVRDPGSHVHATSCHFLHNHTNGVIVRSGGTFLGDGCSSSGNREAGFSCEGYESSLKLNSCTSKGDSFGCWMSGGQLSATDVDVSNSRMSGFHVEFGKAVLKQCSATKCGVSGVSVSGSSSGNPGTEVQGCTLQQNVGSGVLAVDKAVVVVRECHSSHNGEEGYKASSRADMTVSNSSSDGDTGGCGVSDGGKLTMENVSVDSILKSGTLPHHLVG